MHKPIIFAASDYYRRFVDDVCGAYPGSQKGESHIHRFPNGELRMTISRVDMDRDCVIVGSTAPPDDQLLHLIMLSDTLRRAGAGEIHAVLPYLGYARQDKMEIDASGGIALIGILLRSSGISSVKTIDVHSRQSQKLIGLPLESIDSSVLFASHIRELGWANAVFVAPDEGARERTSNLAYAAGSDQPIAYLRKVHGDGIRHLELVGEVSDRAIVVDDILDTGQTLVSACRILKDQGVHEIVVVVTHGLFTGNLWRELSSLQVKKLFVSDSHPQALGVKFGMKQIISIASALTA